MKRIKFLTLPFVLFLLISCQAGVDLTGYWYSMSSSQPTYGSPIYGTPNYGMPGYNTPTYGVPSYGTPTYGNPTYGTPSYGYGSGSNLVLQLQQAGQALTGIAMENNQMVGQIITGMVNGSNVTFTVNFTSLSYGSGPVVYTGTVTPDGNMLYVTPNKTSTGSIQQLTFVRRR